MGLLTEYRCLGNAKLTYEQFVKSKEKNLRLPRIEYLKRKKKGKPL